MTWPLAAADIIKKDSRLNFRVPDTNPDEEVEFGMPTARYIIFIFI
jgi:hypothetical protein